MKFWLKFTLSQQYGFRNKKKTTCRNRVIIQDKTWILHDRNLAFIRKICPETPICRKNAEHLYRSPGLRGVIAVADLSPKTQNRL